MAEQRGQARRGATKMRLSMGPIRVQLSSGAHTRVDCFATHGNCSKDLGNSPSDNSAGAESPVREGRHLEAGDKLFMVARRLTIEWRTLPSDV
jgi:hypothetical protein